MVQRLTMANTLYYGDNLEVLRTNIPDESVDLIYLDPPFNSQRNYNVLFKNEKGIESEAQIMAFEDTWHWTVATEQTYNEILQNSSFFLSSFITSLRQRYGTNQMLAYLVMMTARLIELHRVLKPTGSLYLHCDPTASHYLKIILDDIFGVQNCRTEISWKRASAHNDAKQGRKQYGNIRDIIFFYTKSEAWTWNWLYTPYTQGYLDDTYKYIEPHTNRRYTLDNITGPGGQAKGNPSYEVMGVTRYWRYSRENMEELIRQGRIIQTKPGNVPRYKRYLDEMPGVALQNDWNDISPVQSKSSERLGYPTQKPLSLLERIILASSNEGDVVLDPFCGCGTAVAAAQKLGRRWLGIDITSLGISLQKYRLETMFPGIDINVEGFPKDVDGAKTLLQTDRYQFQWWALSLVRARPMGGIEGKPGKKGRDRGIDGVIHFIEEMNGHPKTVIVQVKSGHVKSGDIRDLRGVIEREQAALGVFITFEKPSEEMKLEAARAGVYHAQGWNIECPRIQILTIEELLRNKKHVIMPPSYGTFKEAQRVTTAVVAHQEALQIQ